MTPTLAGRLQTRLVLLAVVGSLWTLAAVPLFTDGPLASGYRSGFTALVVVAVVGLGWELAYHLIQQFRWDKDWPTLLGLLVGLPEGFVAYRLLDIGMPWAIAPIDPVTFTWLFGTTWMIIWAVASGPLPIVAVRWRFRGGRFW
ncbi:MAG: hypothetical protein GY713_01740 [Actinomycetia bacterium]|nr:hypothetical protein [Actinomycetes bacterium]